MLKSENCSIVRTKVTLLRVTSESEGENPSVCSPSKTFYLLTKSKPESCGATLSSDLARQFHRPVLSILIFTCPSFAGALKSPQQPCEVGITPVLQEREAEAQRG